MNVPSNQKPSPEIAFGTFRTAQSRNPLGFGTGTTGPEIQASGFLIELRPTPGNWPAPVERRLARGLKYLLRQCGLRCTRATPCAANALPWFEKEAKERQKLLSGTRSGPGQKQVTEKIPEPAKGESRQKAAELFHTNPRYVLEAK